MLILTEKDYHFIFAFLLSLLARNFLNKNIAFFFFSALFYKSVFLN